VIIAEPNLDHFTEVQPMPGRPRVSAIISNFNGARYLPKLLETLRAQRGVEVEIIVVDRNSSDESASILANCQGVKVVQEPPESGLVTGYDVGAVHATTELLFFCNEDMWFDPDCLRRLAERIDLPARVFAADPWQWTYDGQTWIHGGTRFRPARLELNAPYPFRCYDFTCSLVAGEVVPFGCAGAILIHRTIYRELGGWDREFFLDHEDVDLFLRAWQDGWKCVTVPDAKVYHAVNVSNIKTIVGGRQRVSRRRYISGRASLPVMGVKYFSTRFALLQFLLWAGLTSFHLLTLRMERARWMLSAGREFLDRLPAAVHFRRSHGRTLRTRPGEKWFLAPEFQAQT
jgi:GT2 family glycosyltransferase